MKKYMAPEAAKESGEAFKKEREALRVVGRYDHSV